MIKKLIHTVALISLFISVMTMHQISGTNNAIRALDRKVTVNV